MSNQRKNLAPKFRHRNYGIFDTRVFGIGFHKTGTSSLARALYILGYNVAGYISDQEHTRTKEEIAEVMISDMNIFNAAQDTPWFIFYRMLDEYFPGSKFILTTRDEEMWIKSVVKHFGSKTIKMHELIYGTGVAAGNEGIYIEKYRQHHDEVLEYFKDRPDDLLVFDLADENKWEKITDFLGFDIPDLEFPHANQNVIREKTFLEKIAWRAYWGSSILRRLILGKNHGSEPWVIRPNLFEYFNDIELMWPKLEELFEDQIDLLTKHQMQMILTQFVDVASRNRNLIRLMENNHNIDFEMLNFDFDGPITLESVKSYWIKCAIEFRYFVSGFNDEDFLVYHPELGQRSYQVFQGIFNNRFFESLPI